MNIFFLLLQNQTNQMETMTEIEFDEVDNERLRRIQSIYANGNSQDEESSEGSEKASTPSRRWFPCRRQPFRARKTGITLNIFQYFTK